MPQILECGGFCHTRNGCVIESGGQDVLFLRKERPILCMFPLMSRPRLLDVFFGDKHHDVARIRINFSQVIYQVLAPEVSLFEPIVVLLAPLPDGRRQAHDAEHASAVSGRIARGQRWGS